MTQQHSITPPPELVEKVSLEAIVAFPDDESGAVEIDEARDEYIAQFFAQWGADQELEACRQWLEINGAPRKFIDGLLAARRPKPPSLKEQALNVYNRIYDCNQHEDFETIRLALEQLPDDTTH
jgi:hypothetical protein